MRVIYYYQTFTGLDKILTKDTSVTHIHLSSIHFGVNPDNTQYIHLNDLSPYNAVFKGVWQQLKQAVELGIEVKLMVGGAGGGYSELFSDFEGYYSLLKEVLETYQCISGIDLDVEEPVLLEDICKLIRRVKLDFPGFSISMAPVQEVWKLIGRVLGI